MLATPGSPLAAQGASPPPQRTPRGGSRAARGAPAHVAPDHPEVWRASQLNRPSQAGCPSGFATLDAELPGGGWPPGALTELLLSGLGQGEWRLLASTLARLSQAGRTVVLVGTPEGLRPYAPALHSWGIALPRLLWVDTAHAADSAWATEQALATQGCGAVLCWAPTLHGTALRRLHLAARASRSLLFAWRPLAVAQQSSPATLRLACRPSGVVPGALTVHLLKRRGPPCETPLQLDQPGLLAPALTARLGALRRPLSTPPSTPLPTDLSQASPTALPPGLSTAAPHPHARPEHPAVVVPAPA